MTHRGHLRPLDAFRPEKMTRRIAVSLTLHASAIAGLLLMNPVSTPRNNIGQVQLVMVQTAIRSGSAMPSSTPLPLLPAQPYQESAPQPEPVSNEVQEPRRPDDPSISEHAAAPETAVTSTLDQETSPLNEPVSPPASEAADVLSPQPPPAKQPSLSGSRVAFQVPAQGLGKTKLAASRPAPRIPPATQREADPSLEAAKPQGSSIAPLQLQASARADQDWIASVSAWLLAHRSYPQIARATGWEGTVVLQITVEPSGRVLDVSLVRGSGSEVLDHAAEALVRSAHLPSFPPDMRLAQQSVTIPLRYRLE